MITIKNKNIRATIDSDLNIMSESNGVVVFLRNAIEEAKKRTKEPPYLSTDVALFYYLNEIKGFEVIPNEELKELLQSLNNEANDDGVVY